MLNTCNMSVTVCIRDDDRIDITLYSDALSVQATPRRPPKIPRELKCSALCTMMMTPDMATMNAIIWSATIRELLSRRNITSCSHHSLLNLLNVWVSGISIGTKYWTSILNNNDNDINPHWCEVLLENGPRWKVDEVGIRREDCDTVDNAQQAEGTQVEITREAPEDREAETFED